VKPIKIPHNSNNKKQLDTLHAKLKALAPNKPSGIFRDGVELEVAQYTIDLDPNTNELTILVPDDAKIKKEDILGE
jgi:hypothetical protein